MNSWARTRQLMHWLMSWFMKDIGRLWEPFPAIPPPPPVWNQRGKPPWKQEKKRGRRGGRKKLVIFNPVFTIARVLEVISSSHELHYNAKQFYRMLLQVKIWFMKDLRFMGWVSWKNKIVEVNLEFSSLRLNPVRTFVCSFWGSQRHF